MKSNTRRMRPLQTFLINTRKLDPAQQYTLAISADLEASRKRSKKFYGTGFPSTIFSEYTNEYKNRFQLFINTISNL